MWLPVIGVWSHVDAAGKPDIPDLSEDPRRKPFFSSPTGRHLQLEEGIRILLQVSSCCALFINNHQSSVTEGLRYTRLTFPQSCHADALCASTALDIFQTE